MSQTSDGGQYFFRHCVPAQKVMEAQCEMLLIMAKIFATSQRFSSVEASVEGYPSTSRYHITNCTYAEQVIYFRSSMAPSALNASISLMELSQKKAARRLNV